MTKKTWTSEEEALLREKYPVCNRDELALLFPGHPIASIIAKAKQHKLRKAVKRFRFTAEQEEEIIRDYADVESPELARRYGCSLFTLRNFAYRHSLKKSRELIVSKAKERMENNPNHPARAYWIKKGSISPNKGKKRSGLYSPEALEKMSRTQFKKGHIPFNRKPVDHERTDSKAGYIYVKVSGNRKMVLKHRYIWEQHNGPIPPGYNIQFRDGNRQNCAIDNLYIISKKEQLANENSMYARYPKEIQLAIKAKGAFVRQINKLKNNGKE
jgi:hypothetical protein